MNAITYETASSASVSELAGVFKLCCQQLYGGGRKLTNLLGGGERPSVLHSRVGSSLRTA